MAPEQEWPRRDERADVFAVGVLLFEMISAVVVRMKASRCGRSLVKLRGRASRITMNPEPNRDPAQELRSLPTFV